MFQYSLNISNKIYNYVLKPLIKSLTTEGELIIIVTIQYLFIYVLTELRSVLLQRQNICSNSTTAAAGTTTTTNKQQIKKREKPRKKQGKQRRIGLEFNLM
jgi:hypothetical protein